MQIAPPASATALPASPGASALGEIAQAGGAATGKAQKAGLDIGTEADADAGDGGQAFAEALAASLAAASLVTAPVAAPAAPAPTGMSATRADAGPLSSNAQAFAEAAAGAQSPATLNATAAAPADQNAAPLPMSATSPDIAGLVAGAAKASPPARTSDIASAQQPAPSVTQAAQPAAPPAQAAAPMAVASRDKVETPAIYQPAAALPPPEAPVVQTAVAEASPAVLAAATPAASELQPADRPATRAEVRAAQRADAKVRSAGLETDAAPAGPAQAKTAAAFVPVLAVQNNDGAPRDPLGQATGDLPKTVKVAEDVPAADNSQAALAAQTTQTAPPAAAGVRADHATVAHLSSQIITKLDAKMTSFDIELHPAGLGKVDVKVEISPSGAITAALSFDNPQAAQELRGRSDELKTALQQAGFNLSDAGLSFNFSDGQQRWAQAQQDQSHSTGGRAFSAAADKADDLLTAAAEAAARALRRGGGGVDIRI